MLRKLALILVGFRLKGEPQMLEILRKISHSSLRSDANTTVL